ncbi:RHS repeat-associated core domain-containing protein [Microbulbifer sp. THAF38]|uniref:RHS repeat-associated core domain-containing protein n=1 Tax=Microbulbifer sp. THAF38 TaxID=2587856 RepID=UPI001269238F|nr:RHS repeat-associated core domain-containing protein [Microbulbifer sp. THAF38]
MKTDLSGDGSYSKDLQERFEYDGLNRLRYARLYQAGSQTATQEVRYDDAGNNTYKTGVGSYKYNGPRPHAVTKAGNTSYYYDNNGNMSSDSGCRTLDYTVFDKPSLVTKGSHDTRFTYGPDRSRFKRVDDNGKGTVTTLQIGSVEKVIERSTSGAHIKSFYRRNIAGIAIERVELNASDEIAGTSTQYLHKDLQGSLDVITDSTGQVAKDTDGNKLVYSFDAWGKRRNALSWKQIAGAPANTVSALSVGAFNHLSSNRGYTGHEMLDEVGLIHMNGRVYDPTLARFVSADPMIDGVTSVQGYNRYAYVHNNPLTYTDPSGYSSWNKYRDAFVNGRDVMRYLGGKPVLNAVAQIALCISSGPGCPGALAAYNAAQTYHITGEIGLAFANGVLAAASAAAFSGMPGGWSPTNIAIRGVTGGILAKLGGGKFAHGFISAGVGGGFANDTHIAVRMLASGLVSEATGGKFVNGAAAAAFTALAGAVKRGGSSPNPSFPTPSIEVEIEFEFQGEVSVDLEVVPPETPEYVPHLYSPPERRVMEEVSVVANPIKYDFSGPVAIYYQRLAARRMQNAMIARYSRAFAQHQSWVRFANAANFVGAELPSYLIGAGLGAHGLRMAAPHALKSGRNAFLAVELLSGEVTSVGYQMLKYEYIWATSGGAAGHVYSASRVLKPRMRWPAY